MMRFFLTLLTVLLASPVLTTGAQETVDIQAVADEVTAVDSERLLMGLNTPIPNDLLPAPFSNPRLMENETLAQQRATFSEAFPGLSGSVVYTANYMPEPATASPVAATASPEATPGGSPAGRSPQAIFSSSTLTYLVYNEPVDTVDQDAFASSLQTALGSEAQQGTVEWITVNDVPAVRVSAMTVVNAVEIHAQWIAVPVGSVVVIGMVMTGTDSFEEDAFNADNEALVLSGIRYLASVAGE